MVKHQIQPEITQRHVFARAEQRPDRGQNARQDECVGMRLGDRCLKVGSGGDVILTGSVVPLGRSTLVAGSVHVLPAQVHAEFFGHLNDATTHCESAKRRLHHAAGQMRVTKCAQRHVWDPVLCMGGCTAISDGRCRGYTCAQCRFGRNDELCLLKMTFLLPPLMLRPTAGTLLANDVGLPGPLVTSVLTFTAAYTIVGIRRVLAAA